jgi:acyl-CoA thioester hydrolase
MVRHLGVPYATVEERGILMPVIDLSIKYKQPAYYDNVLRIRTTVPGMPRASFPFEYEVYNEENQLILTAELRLAFIDKAKNRPVRVPDFIREAIEKKMS